MLDATEPVTGYSLADGAKPYDAGHPAVIGWRTAAADDGDHKYQ